MAESDELKEWRCYFFLSADIVTCWTRQTPSTRINLKR